MDPKTLRSASSSGLSHSSSNLLSDDASSSLAGATAPPAAAAAAAAANASASTSSEPSSAASASTAAASAASSPAVTPTSVLEAIKEQKEWAKAVAFERDGRIIAATVKPLEGEVDAFLKLFDKRDNTIGSGIILLNEQYDVHRFHPPLIYGRRGDTAVEDSEGIAVCRVEKKASKHPVFCLITYTYPTLSARAVPQLKEFCDNYLAYLP